MYVRSYTERILKLKNVDENFLLAHLSSIQQRNNTNMENALSQMTNFLTLLNDNVNYLHFNQKAQIRLCFISEKMKQLTMKSAHETGLAAIESMLRHHKLLEIEVRHHSEEYRALANVGKKMILEGNIMSSQIESEILQVSKLSNELNEKMQERKQQLDFALAYEHYQLDCNELLIWIREKELFLEQNGNADAMIFDILHSKILALKKEIMQQEKQISLIAKQREFLLALAHVRDEEIEGMYNTILEALNRLSSNAKKTENKMAISSKYLGLLQDCNNIKQKIKNRYDIAASEDYGKDLIHVEELLTKFDTCLYDNRIIAQDYLDFRENCEEFLNMDIFGSKIHDHVQALVGLWKDTEEMSFARKEALFQAKVIHTFDKTTNEIGQELGEEGAILEDMIICDGDDLKAFSDMLDTINIVDLKTKVRELVF